MSPKLLRNKERKDVYKQHDKINKTQEAAGKDKLLYSIIAYSTHIQIKANDYIEWLPCQKVPRLSFQHTI